MWARKKSVSDLPGILSIALRHLGLRSDGLQFLSLVQLPVRDLSVLDELLGSLQQALSGTLPETYIHMNLFEHFADAPSEISTGDIFTATGSIAKSVGESKIS